MANPMYPILLEEMGQALKTSKRDLEADIKEMAEYWESCLEKAQVTDRDTAIFLLTTCINCYLRGKGIRLGNYQMLKKNNGLIVSLVTLIPLYAWDKSVNKYPKIFELMPMDIYKVETKFDSADILSEAERILRERSEE